MGRWFQCKDMHPEGYKLPDITQDRSTKMSKWPSQISGDDSKESLTIISTSRMHWSSKTDQAMKEVQFLKWKLKDEQSKVRVLEEKNARLWEQISIAKSSKASSNARLNARETSFQRELCQALEESKQCASRLQLADNKIQRLSGCNNIATELDPEHLSEVILWYLEESELMEEPIVEGFLSMMCTEKKF